MQAHKCEVCGRNVRKGVVAPGGRWMHEVCWRRRKEEKQPDHDRIRDQVFLGVVEDESGGKK